MAYTVWLALSIGAAGQGLLQGVSNIYTTHAAYIHVDNTGTHVCSILLYHDCIVKSLRAANDTHTFPGGGGPPEDGGIPGFPLPPTSSTKKQ